ALPPPPPRGAAVPHPGARGDRVPVQEVDAVPRPGGRGPPPAGGPAAAAEGVPRELRPVLQGAARRLRPGAGGLPPDPHRRAGGPGAGHLPEPPPAAGVSASAPSPV